MYNFNKIGVVVDNTEIDQKIFEACKMLDHQLFDIQEIHIIHATKFNVLEKQVLVEHEELANLIATHEADVFETISKNVAKAFGSDFEGKIAVHILKGSAANVVLDFQKKTPMDIFIGGKKKDKDKSGRFVKDLIRGLTIPVMMIPEDMAQNWTLKSILVPYDYSTYSDKAMITASALQKLKSVESIECFHLIDSPAFSSGSIVSSEKIVRYIEEDRQMEFAAKIEELKITNPPLFKIQLFDKFPGKEIYKRAELGGFSLIVMGAKGHSILERFFLGSVTEKLISLNDTLPLLNVR